MQIPIKSKIPKISSGIAMAILIIALGWFLLSRFWFWVSLEIIAAALVAVGCSGEWWLHHHSAGRKKKEKDEHHRLESRFIAMVSLGVIMELFALGHSIREGAALEDKVSEAKEHVATLESNNLVLRSNIVALEIRQQPRRIAPIDHATLVKKLSRGISGPIAVQEDWTDAEAGQFGRDILSVLADSGFEIRVANAQVLTLRSFGAFMFVKNVTNAPPHALLIQRAFREIGVFIDGKNAWQSGGRMEEVFAGSNSNLVFIWVSQKP